MKLSNCLFFLRSSRHNGGFFFLFIKSSNTTMQNFLKFCSIVSIIIAAFRLAIIGNLSPGTVVFIIICSLLILMGGKVVFTITAAIAAVTLFVKVYGGDGSGQSALLQGILCLALVCFGLYTVISGAFPSIRSRRRY